MRIGKERCERKAYPHRVYPDRNRIQLHLNRALCRYISLLDYGLLMSASTCIIDFHD